MAIFSFQGSRYNGTPLRQLSNGNWIFEAKQHGPRFVQGGEVELKPSEIIEMGAAEMPDASDGMAELQKGLAAERKEITPVSELLAKAKAKAKEKA